MSQPLVFVGLVDAVTPVQNPPVTWQKKDAGDPTAILRNIAEFHSCINLMSHCFATPGGTSPNLWGGFPEENAAAQGGMLCV